MNRIDKRESNSMKKLSGISSIYLKANKCSFIISWILVVDS